MQCFHHPETEAVATCAECGKAICHGCAVDLDGRLFCRQCVASGTATISQVAKVPTVPANRNALTSMICGLGGWLLWLILVCFNFTIGSLIAFVTMGMGALCLVPLGLLPYLGWIPAIVTGHLAIRQLNESGDAERGRGMALTGLISGYAAVGLTLIGCLALIVLTVAGAGVAGIPVIGVFLEEIIQELGL